MGEPVDAGVIALQPSGEEIDGQRKSVHFRKQRNQKRAERAERTPVAGRLWLEEAVGEQDEDDRIDEYEAPQAIG